MTTQMEHTLKKFMVKNNQLQLEFIETNWIYILSAAAEDATSATLLWQFLATYSSELNTRMYTSYGKQVRDTFTSEEAKQWYRCLYKTSPSPTLGILKELLALCNSTGGIWYYNKVFRPLIIGLFGNDAIDEITSDPTVIGRIDIQNERLLINHMT